MHCRLLLLAPLALLALVASAPACSVPVFRYAAERWLPDMYDVIVFHQGPLTPAQKQLVEQLEKASFPAGGTAPIEVTKADLAEELDPALKDLWQAQRGAQAPWLVLRTPRTARKQEAVWSAGLNSAAIDVLLYSPLRHRLAEAIHGGDSAVWVLLECGDKAKDDAAYRLLRDEIRKLERELKLPDLKADRPEDRIERGPNTPELRIGFSVVRLSRNDPDEQPLVNMLLRVEDDLLKFTDEPMAFPVFGRGRALYALVGKGINSETIGDACAFLIGPCGCEVKRLNPGSDVLISADWDGTFRSLPPKEPTEPKVVVTPTTRPQAQTPATAPKPPPPPAPTPEETPDDNSLLGLFMVLLLGLAGTIAVAATMGRWLRV